MTMIHKGLIALIAVFALATAFAAPTVGEFNAAWKDYQQALAEENVPAELTNAQKVLVLGQAICLKRTTNVCRC